MLTDFEVGNLADGIPFCLAVLVSLEGDKQSDDDELEALEEDLQANSPFCKGFLRSN